MTTPEPDTRAAKGLGPVLASVASVGGLGVVAAFFASGPKTAAGVAAGAGLAVANLWAFARLGTALLSTTGAKGPWLALAFGKLIGLFALVWFLLSSGLVDPLALASGYLALPAGIALSYSLFRADRNGESA